ncbi:MAG: hypothetical protein IJ105_04390 [Bacilli bacterium]|nr:hypothetical protein [Bacilli bacterium]
MNEIKLPIKYTLFPINDNELVGGNKTISYIIGKCYVLEENIKYDLEGNIFQAYTIISCKNITNAVKNNEIDEKYIEYVKYLYSDYNLAKEKRLQLNNKVFEKLSKNKDEEEIEKLKIKIEKLVKSMQKLRDLTDKKYVVSNDEKKLELK